MKEIIKEDTNEWKEIPCSWTKRINLLKYPYYSERCTGSMQFLLKFHSHVLQKEKTILKCMWDHKGP